MAADQEEEKAQPLLIFYDSEAANGNIHYGDVIEIAATCHPGIVVGSFDSLINTRQPLCNFALHKSGIKEQDLKGKPFIVEVIHKFLVWIQDMVKLANTKNKTNYFPVICAHGGNQFDFLILFSNLERKGFPYQKFSQLNIHFADSFLFCKELQESGNNLLENTRLSIDGLFNRFFPKHTIKERHRAMGDVTAMIKIFTQTPLKDALHLMNTSTTQERVDYYVKQASRKIQLLVLEEKLSSLDACSRNMSTKRLLQEGMTYDVIQNVFQSCSSYLDFYHLLKKIGIERKVAKVLVNQFGALGLQNQGSLGYSLAKRDGTALSNGVTSEANNTPSVSNGSSSEDNNTQAVSNGLATEDNMPSFSNGSVLEDSVTLHSKQNAAAAANGLPQHVNNSSHNKKAPSSFSKNCIINKPVSERSISSSQAFEQRPMDYALTSSCDEVRPQVCDATGSSEHESKNSPCSIHQEGKEDKNTSNSETNTSLPPMEFQDCQSLGQLEEKESGGCEDWDSDVRDPVSHSGKFVLEFTEVIPLSVGIDDLTSAPFEEKNSSKHSKRNWKQGTNLSKPEKVDSPNLHKITMNKTSNTATKGACSDSGNLTSLSQGNVTKPKFHVSKQTVADNKECGPTLSPSEDHKTTSKPPGNRKGSNKNKIHKASKPTHSKQTFKPQTSSVVFVQTPGSPPSPNHEMTTFFVGDVEIFVPVEKSPSTKDRHVEQTCDEPLPLRDNSRDEHLCDLSLCDTDIHDDNIKESNGIGTENKGDISTMVSPEENEKGDLLVEDGEGADKQNDSMNRQNEPACGIQQVGGQKEEQIVMDEIADTNRDSDEVENTVGSLKPIAAPLLNDDKVEPGSEDSENTAFELVALEVDATVKASHAHDIPEVAYPGMYPMHPMPYQYPVPRPPRMPPNIGFYPPVPSMMPIFPPPPLMMYPGMTFPGPQGYSPFGGFPSGYSVPGPMYQPMYTPCQDQGGPAIHPEAQEAICQQINRDSPDILGIPCKDGQDNATLALGNNKYDSYSTTSDDYSERCSPYLSQEDPEKKGRKSPASVAGPSSNVKDTSKKSRKSTKEQRKESSKIRKQGKRRHKGKNLISQEIISKITSPEVDELDEDVELVKVPAKTGFKDTGDAPNDTNEPDLSLKGSDVSTSSKPSAAKTSRVAHHGSHETAQPTSSKQSDAGVSGSGKSMGQSTRSSPKNVKVSPKSTSRGTSGAERPASDSSKSLKGSSVAKPAPPGPPPMYSPNDDKDTPKSTITGTNSSEPPLSEAIKTTRAVNTPTLSPPRASPKPSPKFEKGATKSANMRTNDTDHSGDSSNATITIQGSNMEEYPKSSTPQTSTRLPKLPRKENVVAVPKPTRKGTRDTNILNTDSEKKGLTCKGPSTGAPVSKASPPRPSTKAAKMSPKSTGNGSRDAEKPSTNCNETHLYSHRSDTASRETSSHEEKSIQKDDTSESLPTVPPQTSEADKTVKWPLSAWRNGSPKDLPKPQRFVQGRRKVRENTARSATRNKDTTLKTFAGCEVKPKVEPIRHSDNIKKENNSTTTGKTDKVIKDEIVAASVDGKSRKPLNTDNNPSGLTTPHYRDILVGKTKRQNNFSSVESATIHNDHIQGRKDQLENIQGRKDQLLIGRHSTETNNNRVNTERRTKENGVTRSRDVEGSAPLQNDAVSKDGQDGVQSKEKSQVGDSRAVRSSWNSAR